MVNEGSASFRAVVRAAAANAAVGCSEGKALGKVFRRPVKFAIFLRKHLMARHAPDKSAEPVGALQRLPASVTRRVAARKRLGERRFYAPVRKTAPA